MRAWPSIDEILPPAALPEGYRLEQLARADVPAVVQKIRAWYPDVSVGAESRHLDEAFYDRHVALAGEDEDRSIHATVVRKDGALVGFGSMEYDELSRALNGRLVVLDPAHRSSGVGALLGTAFSEALGRRIGAEILLTTTTMRHAHGQLLLEKAGFKLCGIIPGFDRDLVAPGVVKRVYEALYVKVLVGDAELLTPDPRGLSPAAAALMGFLFKAGGA